MSCTIEEFLKGMEAYGFKKAVRVNTIARALDIPPRKVRAMVFDERTRGTLICYNTKPGGYYLPDSPGEVYQQKVLLEQGIRKRAMALRPFRQYCRRYKEMNTGPEIPDYISKNPLDD